MATAIPASAVAETPLTRPAPILVLAAAAAAVTAAAADAEAAACSPRASCG